MIRAINYKDKLGSTSNFLYSQGTFIDEKWMEKNITSQEILEFHNEYYDNYLERLKIGLAQEGDGIIQKEDALEEADKVLEAGAILCGGHTIEDPELKYGLAVTGFVRPDKVLSNSSAKEGDLLILTKAIGSGVLTTAAKAQLLSGEYEKSLIAAMTALNAKAQQSMLKYEVNSCTDITGFGLMGHVREMAEGSGFTAEIKADAVPILPGALEFANMGIIPAGAYRNREFIEDKVSICETVNRAVSDILFDPQTSGGLLISLPENQAHRLLDDIKAHTPDAAIIGCIKAKGEHAIEVV